jgi:hypothetical protein
VAEPELLKIERIDEGVDRTNRIIAIYIVFHARRQKARLFPANANLEGMIRHPTNRTPLRQISYEFLPSLKAKSGVTGTLPPDVAEPVIGPRFVRTRWLHPGYGLAPNVALEIGGRRAGRQRYSAASNGATERFGAA